MKIPSNKSDLPQKLKKSTLINRVAAPASGRTGFTLIEILAVVAILTILAALLMPTVRRVIEKSHTAKCMSNLKQIGAGAALVTADNDGMLPNRLETINSATYKRSIADYIYPDGKGRPLDGGVFRCPSADENKKSSLGASLGTAGPGYNYLCYGRNNALSYGAVGENLTYRVAQIGSPSKRMLAIESNTWNFAPENQGNIQTRFAPRHRGTPTAANPSGEMAHVLFIDGHVEARAMSMSPIDLAEWSELGTSGARSNMGQ